jgi:Holliday junction resolvase RusA-like endonuclease
MKKTTLSMTSIMLDIKPLSVNRCWQGRRFKTKDYLQYERDVLLLLPKNVIIKGEVEVNVKYFCKHYGLLDIDNISKPLLDILVKNGMIEDDRKITKLVLQKIKSQNDYLEIEIIGNEN